MGECDDPSGLLMALLHELPRFPGPDLTCSYPLMASLRWPVAAGAEGLGGSGSDVYPAGSGPDRLVVSWWGAHNPNRVRGGLRSAGSQISGPPPTRGGWFGFSIIPSMWRERENITPLSLCV